MLGKYVREEKALTLMDAIRKSSLMPAQRLEAMSPQMRQKGRIKVGADADLSVFDPNRSSTKPPLKIRSSIPKVSVMCWSAALSSFATASCRIGIAPGQGIRAQ